MTVVTVYLFYVWTGFNDTTMFKSISADVVQRSNRKYDVYM